ncbi:MAG: gluconate 2-dehydrogenase gamma chain [Rhodothermales bacterium]|jgi:gluconate 2-dehydrogenase gamma chain
MGVVLAPGIASAILSGCGPEPGADPGFLTTSEHDLVADLAEMIIPQTDTPGAREAGVADYVDMLLEHFSDDEARREVRGQLADLGAWLSDHGADRLGDLDTAAAKELMQALDQQAFPGEGLVAIGLIGLPGGETALLRRLKPWTVAGYYTSQIGATMELHQSPLGSYKGDVPMSEVGKAWA